MDFHIELVHLKEDLMNEIKTLDTKFTDLYNKQSTEITKDILTPLDKINIMLQKTDQMFLAITDQQLKIDKITELETFKNRMNDKVISQEIRIKALAKDLEDIQFKYDREILQNLTLPGYVGISCRFKTLSEYLLFNIDDVSKIKMEKELMKKDVKELKAKLDSMMKNVLNVVENSVKRSNIYTDEKKKDFEDLLNSKYKEFNDKIMEMKTKVLTSEKYVTDQVIKLTKLSGDLNYLKENFENILNKKNAEIKVYINELKNKIDKINNEVKKNHKNIDNINNIFKISGILNNVNIDNKKNQKISVMKKTDINNYNNNNIANISFKRTSQINDNIINENSNYIKKNYELFKKKGNIEINDYINPKIIENNKENEIKKNYNNKNESIKNNIINQNNIRTYNELKFKINPKNIKKKQNKINYNINDKIESYSTEGKILSERKTINLDEKTNREIEKNKNVNFNRNINLSDDEKEKKNIKINKNNLEKKINKFRFIKIDKQQNNEKNKKENIENNILTFTDYNFYNKKGLRNLDYYPNEIYNLKRYQFHKESKNENSEESSKRANSDINIDINMDENTPNQLQTSQKVNNIYYPNQEIIKNLKHKDYPLKQFLNRHYTNYNNKSDTKFRKIFLNDVTNQIYERTNIRSNTIDIMAISPNLIKENEIDLNKRDVEIQSNIKIKNDIKPEKVNFKFISIDNQFKMALNKKKIFSRNNPELILSTPLSNVFKTFQMRKNKDNNNFLNIGQSFNNKDE